MLNNLFIEARLSMRRNNFYSGSKSMKSIVPLLLFAIFSFSVNAQSKSTLIFGDALLKDKRMERIGTVLTVVGSATLFTGNLLYWKSYNDNGNNEPDAVKVRNAGHIMLAGISIMAVGIPLWAIGKSRERHIRIEAELVKFKGFASADGVGIKINF
jgi:hypothetical protein